LKKILKNGTIKKTLKIGGVMAISVFSYSYLGVESYIVEVEVDLSNGLPVFNIVGMGDLAISESKERIRSCFKNIGVDFL